MTEHKSGIASISMVVALASLLLASPLLAQTYSLITPEQRIKGDGVQIMVEERTADLLVRVSIGKKTRAPGIKYTDVTVHLFDDQGVEMTLQTLKGERERWIEVVPNSLGGSYANGFYTCALANGHSPAKATIEYQGEKHTLAFLKWSEWREQEDKKEKLRPR